MKKLMTVVIIMCLTVCAGAQKNKKHEAAIPSFGSVEKADLEMKDCDFDPKASALVLLDDGDLSDLSGLQLKRRIRIKILTDKGLDQANIHLRYRSEANDEDITGLDAQTYNLDESGNVVITKLEKKLVYEKKLNKKYSEKVFTFPGVKVGSVIEYKYNHTNVGLINWYFQRTIPVKYSRFVIDLPSELEVHVTPYCSRKYEESKDERNIRTVKTYVMTDEPGFRDEPYIVNQDFYMDRLETKLISMTIDGRYIDRIVTWQKVIKFLMEDEDFGQQLKRNIPHTAELDDKLTKVSGPYEKMKTVYKYVQDNMQWNEYTGIWASDGVRSAWKDKKGTVGEINLILVNLLKDAKLVAHPVLVSTHDFGIVNTTDAGTIGAPGFLQFDKVMAYVEIGDKYYVLDASEKETPAYLIPADIVMTEGLVIEKLETFEWGWHTLWNKDLSSKNSILVVGQIDDAGKMKGEATITSSDYARLERLPTAKKGKEKFIEKYITGTNTGMKVDDVTFEHTDSDSLPLVQHIKFTQPLTASGDYLSFSANILSGLQKNPFVADNRFSDVFFGVNQSITIFGNFNIPDGYEFEELPKGVKMIMPDTSIIVTKMAQVSDKLLMTKIQVDFKKPIYESAQYPEFQEFYKRLFDLLNEQYVIHKKS